MSGRLAPRPRRVHVVRWHRDNGDVGQRYYTRRHDAQAYAAKLIGYGKTTAVYTATIDTWTETR